VKTRSQGCHRDKGSSQKCVSFFSPPSGGKKRDLEIEEVLFHPNYNINRKKAEGIPEFYDYDVALVKLKSKLKYDQTLR
jgi:hypothetical protein